MDTVILLERRLKLEIEGDRVTVSEGDVGCSSSSTIHLDPEAWRVVKVVEGDAAWRLHVDAFLRLANSERSRPG